MAKAVLTTRIGSGYADVVEEHYHFPRRYLRTVEAAVGDLIVYYQPRRAHGDMSYFATAQWPESGRTHRVPTSIMPTSPTI